MVPATAGPGHTPSRCPRRPDERSPPWPGSPAIPASSAGAPPARGRPSRTDRDGGSVARLDSKACGFMTFPAPTTPAPGGSGTGVAWMTKAGVAAAPGGRATLDPALRSGDPGEIRTTLRPGRAVRPDGSRKPRPLHPAPPTALPRATASGGRFAAPSKRSARPKLAEGTAVAVRARPVANEVESGTCMLQLPPYSPWNGHFNTDRRWRHPHDRRSRPDERPAPRAECPTQIGRPCHCRRGIFKTTRAVCRTAEDGRKCRNHPQCLAGHDPARQAFDPTRRSGRSAGPEARDRRALRGLTAPNAKRARERSSERIGSCAAHRGRSRTDQSGRSGSRSTPRSPVSPGHLPEGIPPAFGAAARSAPGHTLSARGAIRGPARPWRSPPPT